MKPHLPFFSRRALIAAGFGLAGSLALSFTPAAAQDYPEMTFKFGHPYADTHPLSKGAQMFADELAEKSGGAITVQVFGNSTLGAPPDLIDGLGIGVVDFILVPTTNVALQYKPLDLYYLPFLFRDSAHAAAVADGPVGAEINDGLREETGLRTLAMFESGFRTITTADTKIEKPEDLSGVKMRVVNSPINIATFKALGSNPTPMPLSEVFTGLQQGAIDGQDNPIGNVKAFGFNTVQDYITLSQHQWAGIMLLVDEAKWASLPEDLQGLISEVAVEAQNWERAEMQATEASDLKEMEDGGMTVTRLTPEQQQVFRDQMAPVWDEFRDSIGAELIQSAQDAQ